MLEKTVCREKVFSGRVFQVEVRQVLLSDGTNAGREVVIHNGGACIIPVDREKNVYMVHQYRSPFDRVMLEIPAGKLEKDEDPLACAAREMAEETGYRAGKITPLATIYPSPGYCSEILYIYLGLDLLPGKANPDTGEILTCQKYPLEQLMAMIDRGDICDAKTVVALLTLDRRLKAGSFPEIDAEREV